jgi:hypothetical protein
MSFPLGIWTIDANGFLGSMEIEGVDGNGNVWGLLKIGNEDFAGMAGFWNEASQTIIFQRVMDKSGPKFQLYTGYLFTDPLNKAANPFTLAGHFEAFNPDSGGTGHRSVYGWYAQWTAQLSSSPPAGGLGGAGGGAVGGHGPGVHNPGDPPYHPPTRM